MTYPLAGVRVLDLSTEIAGPYCTKLLADAGADVLKIELPEGDPLRRWSASRTPIAAGEDGVLFRFLNTSKRGATIDYTTRAGREQVLALAPRCGSGDRQHDAGDAGWVRTRSRHRVRARSRAVLGVDLAVRPRWAVGRASGDRVHPAGVVRLDGDARDDRPPADRCRRTPRRVDRRCVRGGRGADRTPPRCALGRRRARRRVAVRGDDDHDGAQLVDDPLLARWDERIRRVDEVDAMIHAWTRRHTVAEIVERAAALRIPVAAIGTGETVTGFDHFVARGAFVSHPGASFLQPRPPYRLSDASLRPLSPAPRLGCDSDAGSWTEPIRTSVAATEAVDAARPLAGPRIIDFTAFWAGPFVTHYLAAMGADVIKVESIQRPDGMRFQSVKQPATDLWWEWSALYQGVNLNKRGITLDLTRPGGVALVKHLLARADAAVENFSPRVMDGLGLGYDELARENPRLVLVRMPAFGLDGPWRDRVGFAQTMEQVSGMAWLTGFPDGPPVIPRGACDPLAGLHALTALLVALEHRRRTGRGQLVEATMVEAALNAAAEPVLEQGANGASLARDGNRGPVGAPQNLYACRGDDAWLALSVTSDAQWKALIEMMGDPLWARDGVLATTAGRRARQDEVDRGIGAWSDLVPWQLAAQVPRDALIQQHAHRIPNGAWPPRAPRPPAHATRSGSRRGPRQEGARLRDSQATHSRARGSQRRREFHREFRGRCEPRCPSCW